jgi:hypothetical protein
MWQIGRSLLPRGDTTLALGARRIRFLVVFAVAFPALWVGAVLGMWLDNLLYPRWRRARGGFPVFIVGNFRTGSTFLFRLLAQDRRTFTCMKTWELYFAHSVVQRRLWQGMVAMDKFLGSPVARAIHEGQERVFGDVQLHRIRLEEPEEDEALFCVLWHTLFTCFFFPVMPPGFPYHRFDTALPAPTRRRILAFYDGCIRRHLYAHRARTHYLAKNPSATARIASLLEVYPDARFVCLYRDPVETVPSTMRWFSFAWHYFSSAREKYPLRDFILSMIEHWYRYPLEQAEGVASGRIHFVSYEDLVADPLETVRGIYRALGLVPGADYIEHVRREAILARNHRPDGAGNLAETGLTESQIRARFHGIPEAYEARFRVCRAAAGGAVPHAGDPNGPNLAPAAVTPGHREP